MHENTANMVKLKRSKISKDSKIAKFPDLGKSALYLCIDASDRKINAKFVISDPKNSWIAIYRKKIFKGWRELLLIVDEENQIKRITKFYFMRFFRILMGF